MMETGYLTVKDNNGNDVYAELSMDMNNNWIFFSKCSCCYSDVYGIQGQRNSCKGSCC